MIKPVVFSQMSDEATAAAAARSGFGLGFLCPIGGSLSLFANNEPLATCTAMSTALIALCNVCWLGFACVRCTPF